MNAVNDTCELTEAELDLVAGGAPTIWGVVWIMDLTCDFSASFYGSPWMGTCHPLINMRKWRSTSAAT